MLAQATRRNLLQHSAIAQRWHICCHESRCIAIAAPTFRRRLSTLGEPEAEMQAADYHRPFQGSRKLRRRSRGKQQPINALFFLNKPKDCLSMDVVRHVKNLLDTHFDMWVRVGHGGTLDPMASGVLVLATGAGCKQLQSYLAGSKRYTASASLGVEYDTLDNTGSLLAEKPYAHVTHEQLVQATRQFCGRIQQVPPKFSALRVGGRRMYELARKGVDFDVPSREVDIHSIEVTDFNSPAFSIDVECGGGTYIRSLIRDIGEACGTHAHMTSLVRTKQGAATLENSLPFADVTLESLMRTAIPISGGQVSEGVE